MLNKRVVRLGISLAAALAVTWLLAAAASERETAYQPVVAATHDIEANTVLSSKILEVRQIPVAAAPEGALTDIPGGKLAGQKIWKGEYLLPPMVNDDPVALPAPENRIFSIPVSVKTVGNIQPGDRADVFLFTADKNNPGGGESRMILSGITIVQILNQNGQVLTGKDAKTQGSGSAPAVAEALVTVEQASLLNAAVNRGTLSVARYLPGSQPVPNVPAPVAAGGDVR